MPPTGRPQLIAKPVFLQRLDYASRDPDPRMVRSLLARLRAEKDLVRVGIDFGWVTRREEAHLRNDWLDENGKGWWRTAQPIRPIIREGLTKTVELIRQYRRPIDAYWKSDQPEGGSVFVVNTISPQQITLEFHTPPPPAGVVSPMLTADELIWITQRAGKRVITKPAPAARYEDEESD